MSKEEKPKRITKLERARGAIVRWLVALEKKTGGYVALHTSDVYKHFHGWNASKGEFVDSHPLWSRWTTEKAIRTLIQDGTITREGWSGIVYKSPEYQAKEAVTLERWQQRRAERAATRAEQAAIVKGAMERIERVFRILCVDVSTSVYDNEPLGQHVEGILRITCANAASVAAAFERALTR